MTNHSAQPGLVVPSLFYGLDGEPTIAALKQLIRVGDAGSPHGLWFIADNLITYAHAHGFLTEPRFVAAVLAARPEPAERAIAWRTHTLCWAAESVAVLTGDFVECGTYQGYSAEVLMHFTDGAPGRRFWLYDLFDPSSGAGEGHRLPAHAPELADRVRARFGRWDNVVVTQGKVPQILAETAPEHIAFLHVDMNNAEAERGALEVLFDRISVGGIVVFDDYGWTGYQPQKAAADSFIRSHGLSILELPTGQGLVVKR
jgi:O-methyltransferase